MQCAKVVTLFNFLPLKIKLRRVLISEQSQLQQ